MPKRLAIAILAGCGVLVAPPVANADRAEPPPLYGYYNVFVDFAKQTFNGRPTPMESKSFPVQFSTRCDVNGCIASWDNADDQARNPKAPLVYEYRWNNNRWETSEEYWYLCERTNPDSAVKSQRSDYLIPRPDGSFFGERTFVMEGAGCPGEGPGTHWVPISLTPADPPPPG